jgi:hypothetical protein
MGKDGFFGALVAIKLQGIRLQMPVMLIALWKPQISMDNEPSVP